MLFASKWFYNRDTGGKISGKSHVCLVKMMISYSAQWKVPIRDHSSFSINDRTFQGVNVFFHDNDYVWIRINTYRAISPSK